MNRRSLLKLVGLAPVAAAAAAVGIPASTTAVVPADARRLALTALNAGVISPGHAAQMFGVLRMQMSGVLRIPNDAPIAFRRLPGATPAEIFTWEKPVEPVVGTGLRRALRIPEDPGLT